MVCAEHQFALESRQFLMQRAFAMPCGFQLRRRVVLRQRYTGTGGIEHRNRLVGN